MITVTIDGRRIPFPDADSFDYIRFDGFDGVPADNLTLFDAHGDRLATFYNWDTVDAGDPS